ncbi:FAD binding domain-containing protein [Nannocystaceae bacterium ST9]
MIAAATIACPIERGEVFHQPTTLDEVVALKARVGSAAAFVAGGTDFVVGVRKGRRSFGTLIDLSRVAGLDAIEEHEGVLRIGAMVRHAALERSGITALAEACETVGGPQIRNLGTIGGQIGTASPAGDVSVALIALDAQVELLSQRGARRMPLAELFVGPGRTRIGEDELVSAVFVARERRSAFYKIGKRDAVAISLVMAAASIGPDGDVAIGLGCVAPIPLRPRRAEAHLAAGPLDAARIAEAAAIVGEEVTPISDHRGGADYRRAMAITLTRRLLTQLAGLEQEPR